MKRFRFTLQAVLTVRERQEQAAREQYAQAVARQHDARDRLRVAECAVAAAADRQREQTRAGVIAAELRAAVAYVCAAEERRQQCAGELAAADQRLRRDLEAWLAARQKREAVERLRQRQWQRYRGAVAAQEQKELDELATQRSAAQEAA